MDVWSDCRNVTVEAGAVRLPGILGVPPGAGGIVVFAHGSGSSRLSARNGAVAQVLRKAGLATLLFDLLTEGEAADRGNVFDIPLLATRLIGAGRWAVSSPEIGSARLGYFGASTGAAAALVGAADPDGPEVGTVVSRGGRPDLAGAALARVTCPTLLIVGGNDGPVIDLNNRALEQLTCPRSMEIVPRAGHLFEEPGCLEAVAQLAAEWFTRHLTGGGPC